MKYYSLQLILFSFLFSLSTLSWAEDKFAPANPFYLPDAYEMQGFSDRQKKQFFEGFSKIQRDTALFSNYSIAQLSKLAKNEKEWDKLTIEVQKFCSQKDLQQLQKNGCERLQKLRVQILLRASSRSAQTKEP